MNSTIRMNNNSAKAQGESRMPAALAITICNVLSFFDGCAELLRSSFVRFLLKGSAFTAVLFYIFGCAGAIETNSISFSQAVIRSAVALGIGLLVCYILRNKDEEN